uniref:Histone H4 n=1 Tax=Callithrix jacchus TaxID=9483 RepID=A0A5F4WGY7_CALJA
AGRLKAGRAFSKGGKQQVRKIIIDNIVQVTVPKIQKLARRGGERLISVFVYEETRKKIKMFLTNII